MPKKGIGFLPRDQILSFEEIVAIVQTAVSLGVNKVRLTGGEPLVRSKIERLVGKLSEISSIVDLSMTTNGVLLSEYAVPLAEAGLKRINISLDTVCARRYKEITGGNDIHSVFRGIQQARIAGLDPIKINCVVKNSSIEKDAQEVAEFCHNNDLQVRFIKEMDWASGKFTIVQGGSGGDCPRCNRIRLSANGIIKPCLFSDLGYDVRRLGVLQAFVQAVKDKPKSGSACSHNWVRFMGG